MSTQLIKCDLIDADTSLNIARQNFTPADCEDLAASIAVHGLQTPIMVRPVDGHYEIVFGFRRYTAVAINLGLEEIECKVVDMTREEAQIANVVENLQRKDITFWEECCALKIGFLKKTKQEIATALGKSESWARTRMSVWEMPKNIRDQVQAGILSAAHISLLAGQAPEDRVKIATKLRQAARAGKTIQQMEHELTGRNTRRRKKDFQHVMTRCLENGHMEAVHTLRYVIGEISDTLLYELLDKNKNP